MSSGSEKLGEEPRHYSVAKSSTKGREHESLFPFVHERTLSQLKAESLRALNTGQQRSPAVTDSSQRAAETHRK